MFELLVINEQAVLGWDSQSGIVTFLASFLVWLMFLGLVFLWVINGKIKKEQVFRTLFAVALAWVVAEVIKNLFPSLRPYKINGYPPLTITVPSDATFPSIHTAVALALAVSVFLHNKRTGLIFLFSAALVAIGRVLANVHYLLDVAVGGFLGVVAAFIVDKLHLFNLIKERRN